MPGTCRDPSLRHTLDLPPPQSYLDVCGPFIRDGPGLQRAVCVFEVIPQTPSQTPIFIPQTPQQTPIFIPLTPPPSAPFEN